MTKDPNAVVNGFEDALRLLTAASAFADAEEGRAVALLYRLADEKTLSCGSLRKALEYSSADTEDGRRVVLEGLLPLLERLGGPELHKPAYHRPLTLVLGEVWKLRFASEAMVDMLERGLIACHDDLATLNWFFATLAVEERAVRESPLTRRAAAALCLGDPPSKLDTIMAGGAVARSAVSRAAAVDEQASVPGGRHDNDDPDFRSVRILPTREEFVCDAEPYLPKSAAGVAATEAALLDRHFRLLREDMLGPAKEALGDPRRLARDMYLAVQATRIESGGGPGWSWPCVCFSFQLPKWHRVSKLRTAADRADYWERNQRALPRDALVCLLRHDATGSSVPVRFGVIKRREPKELSGQTASKKFEVGVAFFSREDMVATIHEMTEPTPRTELLVVSASLFAYQPVLRGLQIMTSVPLAGELLRGTPQLPDYTPRIPGTLAAAVAGLDRSQHAAVDLALTNRVALIQGPPGTGKTHIGVLLTRAILESTSETVLCVCYTNHALDAFLEDLLNAGVTKMVRLGGRSKSPRLDEYNMRQQAHDRGGFTPSQRKRYAQIKEQIEREQRHVDRLRRMCGREIGAKWWDTVGEHLRDAHRKAWDQLVVTDADLVDADGFRRQGETAPDFLWKLWLKGGTPKAPFKARADQPLWQMSKNDRVEQKAAWQREIFEEIRGELADALETIRESKLELEQMQDSQNAGVLCKARLIGCTTTKAAMCKQLLDEVAAGVVVVEEAAEILEAHVITSLSERCKHLIMIGDHKQLRPKAEHYPLTVESNRGYDLNRSLFERLAAELPMAALEVQHRMHPEISAIPRMITYPGLRDADEVADRGDIRGLARRVQFVDHNHPEDGVEHAADAVAAVSKTNSHEVGMVVATVRYLLQQGYQPSDLVVLTPYLGQMIKLQAALAKADLDVFVGDVDLNEARHRLDGVQGFDIDRKGGGKDGASVRVATVDNYQGEEADIVVVSLVRCNASGNIGFLQEPERVNVMLSRARCGQILIGSRATLESARGGQLWSAICGHLHISTGLDTACHAHGEPATLTTPGDFEKLCPNGGCTRVCQRKLPCGHDCAQRCHTDSCDRAQCAERVNDECPRGHPLERECREGTPKCTEQIEWTCAGQSGSTHVNLAKCHVSDRRCRRCADILRIKKETKERLDNLAAEKAKLEARTAARKEKALGDCRVAEAQRREFERRKADELEVRRLEIEARRQIRELQIRKENAGDEIDELVRELQAAADDDVRQIEHRLSDELRAREVQAAEDMARIETEMREDVRRLEETRAEQERISRDVVQQCEHELARAREQADKAMARLRRDHEAHRRNQQARVQAERDRAAAELLAQRDRVDACRVELDEKADAEVKAARDHRDRELRVMAVEQRELDGRIAAIPTQRDALTEQRLRCAICLDPEVRRIDGYLCNAVGAERHFVCDACFEGHVQAQMGAELADLQASGGQVFCTHKAPDLGCDTSTAIAEADIFRHAPDAIPMYLDAQRRLLEVQLTQRIRCEERDRLEAEQHRLARLTELERQVHRHRTHVVDNLLTLKCPKDNCRQAFLDFTGCFALTCSRCRCGFCAWCLRDCGHDAHAHVAECPLNRSGDVFGNAAAFAAGQRDRRVRLVRAYLSDIDDADVRMRVVEQCRHDFVDLQMRVLVDEFGGRAPGPRAEANAAAGRAAAGAAADGMALDAEIALALHMEDQGDLDYL